ncbi:MAG: aspartate carbamoyltransferase [Deltaproteobacteria bacterium RIFCSPLOWO2_12_FULL_50_11]|nr:MAG: aspartate carbamoyltransferase [Deltaproteobacteria bacterium GWA2_50_8]OGQ28978.1 MAG: aspartate carbamoyltransferase [Deltaproteobacteria bacterium RIFCSPHIGHO2_02_FULL_50_15]OGQ67936.1 MAG: aspartate carbamoyltransferase [Deltaproteobacteria bacterium RIFCSPLOWO2_12_FULL_50_11]
MSFKKKDLLSIEDLTKNEISFILDTAASMKKVSTERFIKKVPTLRGRTVINLFMESSTRTRTSFELAAKRLSADVLNISPSTSSITKGESLRDMALNLEAMHPHIFVIRHAMSGAPQLFSQYTNASVVNAGDGAHEHPTQALLDMLTIQEHKGKIKGLNVGIVGDITYSRVARSNIHALRKMGAHVIFVGPATMIPSGIEKLGAKVSHNLDSILSKVDVLMMLRIQQERQDKTNFPNVREYSRYYGLSKARAKLLKQDALIMHPGPINWGVEMAFEIADDPRFVVMEQVTNGVAVRMAVLYLVGTRGEGA